MCHMTWQSCIPYLPRDGTEPDVPGEVACLDEDASTIRSCACGARVLSFAGREAEQA